VEAVVDNDELQLQSDNFEARARPGRLAWDDDDIDPEASTYLAARHGPEPRPEWVITEDRARQYERGLLKTGKEAEVFLVERRVDDRTNLLAAKRYKSFEDRMFRDDFRYRQSRRAGESRVDRAMARGTRAGMAFRARQWVDTEFDVLGRLWGAGVSVPYPVQLLGQEIMLEYIGDEQAAAPRLVQCQGGVPELNDLYGQLLVNLGLMIDVGVVHGDLSAYNLLVWDGRLVLIDLPQAVDPVLNPEALALLERDVLNTWDGSRKKDLELTRALSSATSWRACSEAPRPHLPVTANTFDPRCVLASSEPDEEPNYDQYPWAVARTAVNHDRRRARTDEHGHRPRTDNSGVHHQCRRAGPHPRYVSRTA
jgi:RIO kinase 1